MIVRKWFSKKQTTPELPQQDISSNLENKETVLIEQPLSAWQRLKQGLKKTRLRMQGGLSQFFSANSDLTEASWEELEETLLTADFGIKTTQAILAYLKDLLKKQKNITGDELKQALHNYLVELLQPIHRPFKLQPDHRPHVIMMVGVNGVGKTTTLAKLAAMFQNKYKVMMAAGDTFRAAAIEQLQSWGQAVNIPVVAQSSGSDAAAVIFDALQSAQARDIDVLLADTAGRLHTQGHLLQELQKTKRVLHKLDLTAPQDVMMVLDASIGQNALAQVRQFHQAMNLTGLIVTKLDGSAKGGILFAIAQEFKIPCFFIGIGEGIDDLRPFEPQSFVQAILE
jgi:fused signal recognition particle receptor